MANDPRPLSKPSVNGATEALPAAPARTSSVHPKRKANAVSAEKGTIERRDRLGELLGCLPSVCSLRPVQGVYADSEVIG